MSPDVVQRAKRIEWEIQYQLRDLTREERAFLLALVRLTLALVEES